jgi:DNA replication and repair protein RecF|tara:strand:- start:1244 stop:2332 length:1089 start_codon:yes stop_codon:yes gene_type:complete
VISVFLKKISIINYKNILDKEYELDPKINCFVGDNGVGKTNILDAVYHLSMGKSYFNVKNDQLINRGKDYMLVDGVFELNNKNESIVFSLKIGEKKVLKRNGKPYKKFSNHIGLIPVVLISPYDNDLINEGSSERRKFIDSIISQNDKEYLINLIAYTRVIQNRNKLLKQYNRSVDFDLDTIKVYDDQIYKLSEPIFKARNKFIKEFTPLVLEKYKHISDDKEKISIEYKSDLINNHIENLIKDSFQKDVILQYTSVGLHKDDFVFNIDENRIKRFGSQGQQKSFLIALKLAQFDYLKNETGNSPILLMDDIFDKLDLMRVKRIVEIVNSTNFGQLFLSDTDKERIEKVLSSLNLSSKIFEV